MSSALIYKPNIEHHPLSGSLGQVVAPMSFHPCTLTQAHQTIFPQTTFCATLPYMNTPIKTTNIHAVVSGRVQGVCFRYYTRGKALELGLRGWVRNLADGRVELAATGDTSAMTAFRKWLWQGSPMSSVTEVETTDLESPPSQSSFEIVD